MPRETWRTVRSGGIGTRHAVERGITTLKFVISMFIIMTLTVLALPAYTYVQHFVWRTQVKLDINNVANAVESYRSGAGNQIPAAFEMTSEGSNSARIQFAALSQSLFNTSNTSQDSSDIQVTLFDKDSICYTPSDPRAAQGADAYESIAQSQIGDGGVSRVQNFRITATNANDLSVYYVYNSATGKTLEINNPDAYEAATHTGKLQLSTAASLFMPEGSVCDLEEHYHLFGH